MSKKFDQKAQSQARHGGLRHDVHPIRKLLFGSPIETSQHEHTRVPKIIALPIFSSDGISSVAYASQQILVTLAAAGLWTMQYKEVYDGITLGVTAAIVSLLVVVVTSYVQTIHAYPQGGGSYRVSKDNLGTTAGLVAGAALLIDYVLTVAVSIAAGIQNLVATPIMESVRHNNVELCILTIAVLVLANMRGLKEAGTIFALPTYFFITMAALMIVLGLVGPHFGWQIQADTVNRTVPEFARKESVSSLTSLALLMVFLKSFASGCAALTGIEAVSDGVPAFRAPQSKNAAITLMIMTGILGFLFGGISWLATNLHVVYWEHGLRSAAPVIDQLSGAVFGKVGSPFRVTLYYAMQFSTAAILLLAANTAFADFPRLSSIMARDRFMPRQLANIGDRLVFANGIALLGMLASALIVAFHGKVGGLVPLYAVGVFTAFTLSQSGMVMHWVNGRQKAWKLKASINGFGATLTAIVLVTIAVEKFSHGAWVTILLIAVLYGVFRGISNHYEYLRSKLTIIGWKPDLSDSANIVLVMVPSLHRGIFPAIKYASSLSRDSYGVNIEVDAAETARLKREWEEYVGEKMPLVILPSLYRSIVAPILVYVDEVLATRENQTVTVVLTEFVSRSWWHSLLHNKNGLLLRYFLLKRDGVIVCNVRYFVD